MKPSINESVIDEKKLNAKSTLLIIAILVLPGCGMKTIKANKETAIADKVGNLLAQMTLEEKVGQMTQIDFTMIGVPEALHADYPIDPPSWKMPLSITISVQLLIHPIRPITKRSRLQPGAK
jgi:hypothetical protein